MLLLKEAMTDFVNVCQHVMVNLLLVQQSSMEPFQSSKVRFGQRVGPLGREDFVGERGYFHDKLGFFGFNQVQQNLPSFEDVVDPAVDVFGGSRGIDKLGDVLLELDEGEDHLDFGLHCLNFVDDLERAEGVDEELDGRRLLLELIRVVIDRAGSGDSVQQLLY